MYFIEISHEGLHKYREIKGTDKHVVEQKAFVQQKQWEEMWVKKQEAIQKKVIREQATQQKAEKSTWADQQTIEAQEQLSIIDNTLVHTLGIDDKIDWESLKDNSMFNRPKPIIPKRPENPKEPNEIDYQPKLNILDKMIPSLKLKKIEQNKNVFSMKLEEWKSLIKSLNEEYDEKLKVYNSELEEWANNKREFEVDKDETNEAINFQREQYLKADNSAIEDYCDMVLSNSTYPDYFPQEFDIEYSGPNKTLIVEYDLPDVSDIPTLKEVKYLKSKDEYKETHITEPVKKKMYDKLLYDITLRSIHELFEADIINGIDSIVFNGWVKSINRATGKTEEACILSIQTLKQEFLEINLNQVDSKACFKSLKGIGSSTLYSLTPIAPILKINRDDSRFVSAINIADSIEETTNLAAMDWQDFEHLIRELFEKEFNINGGEVKITRASRDGGVDAVAFDPDPIRGGKIVIQAKRYTNIVGVSAVRDLYGTVLNEGATKGILVSTADYGPDAYSFSKDKPLTLLNGNNLLHLLHKHGHKAKIDLKEAKKMLKENI